MTPAERATHVARSLFLGVLVSVSANAADFFVSPSGSDTNPGTQAAPFKTLARAQTAWRAAKTQAGSQPVPLNVWMMAGVHRLSSSLGLNSPDSGTADFPLTIAAVPGARVELTGSTALAPSQFVAVTDSAVLQRIISVPARAKILQCDLKAAGITDYGVLSRHGVGDAGVSQTPPVQLYVNGERMHLARWPNPTDSYASFLGVYQKARLGVVGRSAIVAPGPKRGDSDWLTRGGTFSVAFDRLGFWTQEPDVWLEGVFGQSWEWSYNRVAQIDPVQKRLTLAYGEVSGLLDSLTGDFFFAENLLGELDEPGEYYIDRASGLLYLYPPADWATGTPQVELATLSQVAIQFNAVSFVTIRDLIFERGRNACMNSFGAICQGVRVERCEIRDFANGGVLLDGTNHAVVMNHLHHLGSSVVELTGGNLATLAPGASVVEQNHIHDWPWYRRSNTTSIRLQGVGMRVANNHIHHNSSNTTISIETGNDHVIENNDIHHAAELLIDSGVIYGGLGQRPLDRGQIVRRNFLHDIGRTFADQEAVYTDEMSMGWTIEQNVFARIGNPQLTATLSGKAGNNNSGAYIVTRNNVYVDCTEPMYLSPEAGQAQYASNLALWQALFASTDVTKLPHALRYPELLKFFQEPRQFPDTNRWDNNLVWNPTLPLVAPQGQTVVKSGAYDGTGTLQVGTNFVATADPGFVNAAADNYNLRADADVFKRLPGFVAIPFDTIGMKSGVGRSGRRTRATPNRRRAGSPIFPCARRRARAPIR